MFRLTREVRFAVDSRSESSDPVTNSYAGYPSLTGFGHYLSLEVTLAGALEPATSYLRNIKEIDQVVREQAIGMIGQAIQQGVPRAPSHASCSINCSRAGPAPR